MFSVTSPETKNTYIIGEHRTTYMLILCTADTQKRITQTGNGSCTSKLNKTARHFFGNKLNNQIR